MLIGRLRVCYGVHPPQVLRPVRIASERFGAFATLERLQASVDVEVLFQLGRLHEALAAVSALVVADLRVRLDVLNESVLGVVYFPADFAQVQDAREVLRHVFHDEVLLGVLLTAHWAREQLFLVHREVTLAGRERRQLQAALATAYSRFVYSLVVYQVFRRFKSVGIIIDYYYTGIKYFNNSNSLYNCLASPKFK